VAVFDFVDDVNWIRVDWLQKAGGKAQTAGKGDKSGQARTPVVCGAFDSSDREDWEDKLAS